EKLNNKIFIAKIYHSQDKLINDIMKGKIKYGSLRKKNEADKINDVNRTSNLIAIFLLDQGIEPRGMPEMYYPTEYINNDSYLKDRALLITDGRFSGATYGFSFGYMEQLYHDEQLKDGALILFDFKNKKINLLNDKQYFKKNKIVSVKKPEKKRKTNRVDSPYRYLLDKIRQK
ncbi:MAG: dihydroxy-acid dehydratase, partial [Spirochaetes bacterium]|nr:dihydroxy-acid dehydratase [Spirochaetota bacterium]